MPRVQDSGKRPPRETKPPQRTAEEAAAEAAEENLKKTRGPADKKLLASISGTYTTAGMFIVGVGMRFEDQGIIGTGAQTVSMADALAESWLDLADQNPAVKQALKRFTEVSAAGTLIAMHVALMVPLLADRGMIPEQFAAMVVPVPAANGNGGTASTD